ncbi:MAG: hypothetical protein AAB842_02995 [Patescibacteria group bacterium]
MNNRLTTSFDSFLKYDSIANTKVCAFVGDRVIPWESNCPAETTIPENLRQLAEFTKKENVLRAAEGALGGIEDTHYKQNILNYKKDSWRFLWEDISSQILSPDTIAAIYKRNNDTVTRHQARMAESAAIYPFLYSLIALEGNNYKKDGAVARLGDRIRVYGLERQNTNLFGGCVYDSKTWFETFQQSYAEIEGLASIFGKVSPQYLKDWLPTILNCYKATPEDNITCKLNWENEDWRHYWEGLYSAIYGWPALKNLLSQSNMSTGDKLKLIQEKVTDVYSPAKWLRSNTQCDAYDNNCGIANYMEGDDKGYSNTLAFIQKITGENGKYTIDYKNFATAKGFSKFTAISVGSAIEQIGQLKYKDDYLQLWQYQPDRFINGKNRKYWQSEVWCDNIVCSQEVFGSNGRFGKTYNSDLADVDWQGRINAMVDAPNNLLLVQEAMNAGLTPDTPLINYKIEKANKELYDAVIATQKKFRDIVNKLTNANPCYLASNFHWGVEIYTNYPDQQWYECPSDANYCCNKSDCQTKLSSALNSCGQGTPNSEQEWQNFGWKAYQKYRFVENWFYAFAGYKSWIWNEELQKSEPTYTPIEETNANIIINKIKIIIEALDYIWQNDISAVGPVNKMDGLKVIFDKLKKYGSWEDQDNEWLMTNIKAYFDDLGLGSSEESSIARKFVANILVTKKLITTKLYNTYNNQEGDVYHYGYVASFDGLFKGDQWREMLPPEEMKNRVIDWRQKNLITDSQRDMLVDAIDNILSPALSTAQTEIIDKFEQNLGEYAFSDNHIYPDFTLYDRNLVCPKDIEKQGFLSRLSCFEKENNATFERLKYPLQGMSQLEKALFFLTDADQDFDGTSSIKQNVGNLKPSIKTDEMEINSALGSDLFTKITGVLNDPIGSIWRKFSGEEKGTPPKLTTEKGEIRNWKDFKEALIANPILALQEDFDNIKAKIGQVKDNLDKAQTNIRNNWNDWSGPDAEKRESYVNAVNVISGARLGKLDASVFGNKENQQACQGVSILLGSAMPLEIEQTCKLVVDGGKRNPVILSDTALVEQCEKFERIASMEVDLTQIDSQITGLESKMACAVEEDCSDGAEKPCVKCPEWFCLKDGHWGSGSEEIDSFCKKVKDGQYPNLSLKGANTKNIVWSASLQMKDREWPPRTGCPCIGDPAVCFAKNYQTAQTTCIESQQMLAYLREVKTDGAQAIGINPETAIKCTELNYQKALKNECDDYEVAKGAIKDNCGDLSSTDLKNACSSIKTQIRTKFCNAYDGHYVFGGIDCSSGFPDLTSSAPKDQEALEKVAGLCEDVPDIKTPLNEIMKVYSVLIGIRSGTLASGGIKSTITDSKKLFENIKKFIKMIEELPKKMGKALDGENSKFGKGGFKITPLKCVAKPAASSASGRLKTGADGGLVCPEVSVLYQQIQGQFAVIRNELHQIDLARRVVDEVTIPLWKTEKQKGDITIFTRYPIKYRSIDPVYDRAQSIKQKAQYVWALTTAIDFANSQCVCGQSFCKLPFCISGLPLTLQPLKDPYCSLVWLLRTPLDDLARSLNDELKNLPDSVGGDSSKSTLPPASSLCTDGVCDTTAKKYCNAKVWTPANDSLYCSKCSHCADGLMNCGEAGVDCNGGGCGRCMDDIIPPTITNVQLAGPVGTIFTINAKINDPSGVDVNTAQAYIKNSAGTESNVTPLFDDSSHGDGVSGDGVYGNKWDLTGFGAGPYFVDILACDAEGNCTKSKSSKTQEQIIGLTQQRQCVNIANCVKCPAWICEGATDSVCQVASRCEDASPPGGRKVCKKAGVALFDVLWPNTDRTVPSAPRKDFCINTQKQLNLLEMNGSGMPYWETSIYNTIQ